MGNEDVVYKSFLRKGERIRLERTALAILAGAVAAGSPHVKQWDTRTVECSINLAKELIKQIDDEKV